MTASQRLREVPSAVRRVVVWDAREVPVPTSSELATHAFAVQQPMTYGWSSREDRLVLLAVEHQIDVDMVTDLEFARSRRDRFAPDVSTDMVLNSWLEATPDLGVMLSMRYEGGDPGCPFVEVSALTRAVIDSTDIAAVAAAALERFGPLRPAYLRWFSPEPAGVIAGTSQDKRFLAAPLGELVDQAVPDQLVLKVSADVAHYDDATYAYESFGRSHPDHYRG